MLRFDKVIDKTKMAPFFMAHGVCMYVYIYFRHKTHSKAHKQTHKKNRTNSDYQQKQDIDIERVYRGNSDVQ